MPRPASATIPNPSKQPGSIRRVLMYESGSAKLATAALPARYVHVLWNKIALRKAIMHAKVSPFPGDVDGGPEPTRPIRALNRGLDVLTELNRVERAAI